MCCRYFELATDIGELEPFRDIRFSPPKSALLNIYLDDQSCWQHRFSLDCTTKDVKRILSQKFVGLPTSAFTVRFNDVGSPFGVEPMKYPDRTLRRYGAKDDDELHVQLTTRRT